MARQVLTPGPTLWLWPGRLVQPSDVVAVELGGIDTPLAARDVGSESWQSALLQIETMVGEIHTHGLQRDCQHFRKQPCDSYVGSLATSLQRHWGNQTSVFAGGKQTDISERRPRSPSDGGNMKNATGSDDSHRRRRLLAVHLHEHL